MADESICNGLKLDLKPVKETYRADEMPEFNAQISNVSEREILFCTYMITHRLLCSLVADGYEVIPFGPSPRPALSDSDFVALKPGERVSFPVRIASEPSYGFVQGSKLPPQVPKSFALKGFPRGEYEFKAYLGEYVSFYSSPEGAYNYGRDRKQILREVQREQGMTRSTNGAWQGELTARCRVTFS